MPKNLAQIIQTIRKRTRGTEARDARFFDVPVPTTRSGHGLRPRQAKGAFDATWRPAHKRRRHQGPSSRHSSSTAPAARPSVVVIAARRRTCNSLALTLRARILFLPVSTTGASPVNGWAEPSGLQSPTGLRSRSAFLPVCLQGPPDLLFRLRLRPYRLLRCWSYCRSSRLYHESYDAMVFASTAGLRANGTITPLREASTPRWYASRRRRVADAEAPVAHR